MTNRPYKVIIAGSRKRILTCDQYQHLYKLLMYSSPFSSHNHIEIVTGDAAGIDKDAQKAAMQYNSISSSIKSNKSFTTKIFYARWDMFGKAAGPIRNRAMAEYADACILFPGGRGTANMKKTAIEQGLLVYEWKNDSSKENNNED